MQIMRGLIRLQDARAFPCWAFRIVTRRCQLQFKRADRERQTGEALLAEQTLAPTDSNAGEQSVDLAQVGRALSCLPASQRAAMALFYIENLSVAEIAVALDVPPGTVKTRLMHARQKIRAALEGAEHEPD
jgi:RNA polymerase sigma-70 factor (ECF subfamily)